MKKEKNKINNSKITLPCIQCLLPKMPTKWPCSQSLTTLKIRFSYSKWVLFGILKVLYKWTFLFNFIFFKKSFPIRSFKPESYINWYNMTYQKFWYIMIYYQFRSKKIKLMTYHDISHILTMRSQKKKFKWYIIISHNNILW